MIQRVYLLHFRTVRAVIANALTIGSALLLSYFILWARL
jgi:hypothetical protein